MWHVWETGRVQTLLWWGDLRGTDHLKDLGVDGRIILKCACQKWGEETWT